jgi:prolyl-tRNA synthetase
VTVGKKAEEKIVEVKWRKTGEMEEVSVEQLLQIIRQSVVQ